MHDSKGGNIKVKEVAQKGSMWHKVEEAAQKETKWHTCGAWGTNVEVGR